jgi:hypothetical protein
MTPRHGLGEDRLPLGQPGEPGNVGGEELVALLVGGDGGAALDIGGDRALVAAAKIFTVADAAASSADAGAWLKTILVGDDLVSVFSSPLCAVFSGSLEGR